MRVMHFVLVAVDASEDKAANPPRVGYAVGVYRIPATSNTPITAPGVLGRWVTDDTPPNRLYARLQRLPPTYGQGPPDSTIAEGLALSAAFRMLPAGTPLAHHGKDGDNLSPPSTVQP